MVPSGFGKRNKPFSCRDNVIVCKDQQVALRGPYTGVDRVRFAAARFADRLQRQPTLKRANYRRCIVSTGIIDHNEFDTAFRQ